MTTPAPPVQPRDAKAEAAATKAYAKAQRPWFKRKRWIASIGFVVLILAAAAGSSSDSQTGSPSPRSEAQEIPAAQKSAGQEQPAAAEAEEETVASDDDVNSEALVEKAEPEMTSGQRNALGAAKNYLEMSGFSRAGLISQLSSSAGEGFSRADATYAVNHAGADWNAEAVESAKAYLDMSPMSKSALIDQLSSSAGEKFTRAQAEYAADKVY